MFGNAILLGTDAVKSNKPIKVVLVETTTSTSTTTTTSTTVAPPPTTGRLLTASPPHTHRPRVRASRAARGVNQPATGNDVWRALANCESALGNDSKSGKYHGYFQFSLQTWRGVGESGDPHTFSYEHQKAAAIRLQARSGWGQWPVCSRKLGLR